MKKLSAQELKMVSGGMRWGNNRQSTNVEDRRGTFGSVNPNTGSYHESNANYGNEGRNSTGGSSSSRVICTHFFKKGLIPNEVWRADLEFTFKHLSPSTVRGYHFWAIPYVRLMRKSVLAEKLMLPLALWRAEELAFKMGVKSNGNFKGKLVRLVGESVCFSIGLFVGERNWKSLWVQNDESGRRLSQG